MGIDPWKVPEANNVGDCSFVPRHQASFQLLAAGKLLRQTTTWVTVALSPGTKPAFNCLLHEKVGGGLGTRLIQVHTPQIDL